MSLAEFWFGLIAFLFAGYFFLEGFDFGVGMLLPVLGRRDDIDRRVMINTIGPVWDMNETWLIVAGGAHCSPRSRTGTRRCSAGSTCRCC